MHFLNKCLKKGIWIVSSRLEFFKSPFLGLSVHLSGIFWPMLVRMCILRVAQVDLYVSCELHHQLLTGAPVAIVVFEILDSYRLKTQYTKNVRSLFVKEVGIRQSRVTL